MLLPPKSDADGPRAINSGSIYSKSIMCKDDVNDNKHIPVILFEFVMKGSRCCIRERKLHES